MDQVSLTGTPPSEEEGYAVPIRQMIVQPPVKNQPRMYREVTAGKNPYLMCRYRPYSDVSWLSLMAWRFSVFR